MPKSTPECAEELAAVQSWNVAPCLSTTRQVGSSLTPLPFEAPPMPEGASEPPPALEP